MTADTLNGQNERTAQMVEIDRDRLSRLIEAAKEYEIELEWRCGEYLNVSKQCTSVLRDGDLEE